MKKKAKERLKNQRKKTGKQNKIKGKNEKKDDEKLKIVDNEENLSRIRKSENCYLGRKSEKETRKNQ